jgi:hypothetical protein
LIHLGSTLLPYPLRKTEFDNQVMIFSHGHFTRVFIARWCGFPLKAGYNFAADAGGVSAVPGDGQAEIWLEPVVAFAFGALRAGLLTLIARRVGVPAQHAQGAL